VVLAALRPGVALTDLQRSVKGPSLTLGVPKELPRLSRTHSSNGQSCRLLTRPKSAATMAGVGPKRVSGRRGLRSPRAARALIFAGV